MTTISPLSLSMLHCAAISMVIQCEKRGQGRSGKLSVWLCACDTAGAPLRTSRSMARPGAEELICTVSLDVHASVAWVFGERVGESGPCSVTVCGASPVRVCHSFASRNSVSCGNSLASTSVEPGSNCVIFLRGKVVSNLNSSEG